ncbi:YrdB family protein [Streptomyces sp. NPDC002076]
MSTPPDAMVVRDQRRWYTANEILAFLVELAALACLSWWGFTVSDDEALRILLGVGTPLVAMALWSLFAAPKALLRPRLPLVLAVKAMVLGGGAAALYGVRHPGAAMAMAVIVVANTSVAEIFRHRSPLPRTEQAYTADSPASG